MAHLLSLSLFWRRLNRRFCGTKVKNSISSCKEDQGSPPPVVYHQNGGGCLKFASASVLSSPGRGPNDRLVAAGPATARTTRNHTLTMRSRLDKASPSAFHTPVLVSRSICNKTAQCDFKDINCGAVIQFGGGVTDKKPGNGDIWRKEKFRGWGG